jgi:hypothetical protein
VAPERDKYTRPVSLALHAQRSGDAGIGAGGLLALAAIASGAVVVIRHRPDARHKVA